MAVRQTDSEPSAEESAAESAKESQATESEGDPEDAATAAKLAAPTINLASLVYGLDAYMRSRGADAGDALRRAGLEPGDLTDPDRRVPLIRYLELLEICADLLADPHFGLKFGAQYEPRHVGVVGNVALASRTVGEAFETIGRYLPTMVDATVHGVEVSDGIVFVYSYYIDPLMMSYRQKGDWAIAFACNLMRVGLGDPRWTPQEVLLPQLADETPAERRTRAEIMGDNIRVGHPWAGIRFDAGLLTRPMATADAMIEALMRHYGDLRLAALPEQRGEIEQLRREIARVVVKGEGGIEHLAKATGTDPSDWAYPTQQGLEVRSGPQPNSPVAEKLGLHFVRVMMDQNAQPGPMLRVVTPSGKTGFVPVEALSPLGSDQICYSKEAGGWKISGFVGGDQ